MVIIAILMLFFGYTYEEAVECVCEHPPAKPQAFDDYGGTMAAIYAWLAQDVGRRILGSETCFM